MAIGETKTSINLDPQVYAASKKRADSLGVTFGKLVELALQRDLTQKMAILRTEDAIVYAPIDEDMDPIDEMVNYLQGFQKKCIDKGWIGAKVQVDVLLDIAADAQKWRDELIKKLPEKPKYQPPGSHIDGTTTEEKQRIMLKTATKLGAHALSTSEERAAAAKQDHQKNQK